MAAPVAAEVLDGAMATVEYRIARGRHDAAAVGGAWLAGAEIESSAARRQPLTFEVGSRMVLPVLDHAVRRLAVGEETGAPVRPRRAPLCCGLCAVEFHARSSRMRRVLTHSAYSPSLSGDHHSTGRLWA